MKYNRPCNRGEIKRFWDIQDSILINHFNELANQQIKNENLTIDSISSWLDNWKEDKSLIPNKRLDGIISAFYRLSKDKANSYCLNNWDTYKVHENDRIDYKEIPWGKNFPFVVKLFEYNTDTDLLVLILRWSPPEDSDWKGLVDLISKVLTYNTMQKSKIQKQLYFNYMHAFFELNSIPEDKRNYFLERFSLKE